MKLFFLSALLLLSAPSFAADIKICDIHSTFDALSAGIKIALKDVFRYNNELLDERTILVEKVPGRDDLPGIKVRFESPRGTPLELHYGREKNLLVVLMENKERDSDGFLNKKTCEATIVAPTIVNMLNGQRAPITDNFRRRDPETRLMPLDYLIVNLPMTLEE